VSRGEYLTCGEWQVFEYVVAFGGGIVFDRSFDDQCGVHDPELVAGRIVEVWAVLERFSAFEFVLSEVRRFDNLPNEAYVWLAPTPSRPFVEMVDKLACTFPEHPPFKGAVATVIPHLKVATSTDEGLLERVASQVADALPIKARAETACIMHRVDGLWRLRAECPLATS